MMILRFFGVAAVSALAANALMIPSTVSMPDIKGDGLEAISKFGIVPPTSEIADVYEMDLKCPECSFESEELTNSGGELPNYLRLSFPISTDGKTFLINDAPVFRVDPDLRILPGVLKARQFAQSGQGEHGSEVEGPLRAVSYAMSIRREPVTDDDPDFSLIYVNLIIHGFEDEYVSVNPITIRLLNHEEFGLQVLDAVEDPVSPSEDPLAAIHHPVQQSECPTEGPRAFFCRARAAVEEKLSHIRLPRLRGGCHGKQSSHPPVFGGPNKYMDKVNQWEDHLSSEFDPDSEYAPDWSFRPTSIEAGFFEAYAYDYDWQYYEEPSGVERFASAVRGFITGFLIPVFIGIMAGMTASLLGMVVGTLIGWLWIKVVRGGKRGNASQRQRERELAAELAEEEEKRGLMAHVEEYEDEAPPVYVEKE